MEITIINQNRSGARYSRVSIEELVNVIRDGKYRSQVQDARDLYAINRLGKDNKGRLIHEEMQTDDLPDICFAGVYAKKNQQLVMTAYNALVLLEINNLPDEQSAKEIRNTVSRIPNTYIAFIGSNGHDVKIVCQAKTYDGKMPETEGEMRQMQLNAYRRLHYLYSSQLGLTVDNFEPKLDRCCLMSYDPDVCYNADALAVMASIKDDDDTPDYQDRHSDISDYDADDQNRFEAMRMQYHYCLSDALEQSRLITDDDEAVTKTVMQLAYNCHLSGLPIGFAVKMTMFNSELNRDEQFVRDTFADAYHKELKKYYPKKMMSQSALLTYRTRAFLHAYYDIRRNVMTGVVQCRERDGFGYSFHDLTDAERNTMSIRALMSGIDSWDRDISRYLDSSLIPEYDPVNDYLEHLPRWDGRDRIAPFAMQVKTSNADWVRNFHIWMLSMAAHWMGKDSLHGNAIVPLLIGKQGSGKTSFCATVLPPELRDYYNDRIDFKNETALNLGLSSFALVNIDEFDSVKRSQQPLLKYILSKNDVKMRPPYGKAYEQRRRYASFIATTNNLCPLVDSTGSRRFICIKADAIDIQHDVDYGQLYAQLKEEIDNGARYWLNDEETEQLMRQNLPFQRIDDYMVMIDHTFKKPADCNNKSKMLLSDIVSVLAETYPTLERKKMTSRDVGKCLREMGYENKHTMYGAQYVIEKR